jgi:hypothetical protein
VVELHVDSMAVVQAIIRNGIGSLPGKSLVDRIRRLIELDQEVVIHHSYCKANKYADALTKYECEIRENIPIYCR